MAKKGAEIMPFTTPENRNKTDAIGPVERGDYCFRHYRRQIRAWKKSRRWTTADELAENLFPDQEKRAEFLAYLVFFIKHVMTYENEKEAINGPVE